MCPWPFRAHSPFPNIACFRPVELRQPQQKALNCPCPFIASPSSPASLPSPLQPCKKYGLRLMVHVGTDSIVDGRRLAEHAAKIGAWGIASMPPTYIRPSTVDALVLTMDFISRGAPELPFYYYHIPGMTGVDVKMQDFLNATVSTDTTRRRIPNLNGIKFTDTDLADLLACVRFDLRGRQPNMLYGLDAQLLSALVVGVHGAVGSTYNWNGVLQNKIVKAYAHGDLSAAATYQHEVVSMLTQMTGLPPAVNFGKALMNLIGAKRGLDVGPPRLPQHAPTTTELAEVKNAALRWCTRASNAAAWCLLL